ncbi:hypothetical protein GASC598P17_008770 [Gilliamella apis SCGC AB-598-P17]|nr:hypothetical protein GASC598P17_008770 [Gilliamella apis SCGC AB-598-P17]
MGRMASAASENVKRIKNKINDNTEEDSPDN